MNLKDTYNKIAEEWHKDHQNDDWWIDGTEKFISLLKKNNTVLDAGCGSGIKSKYLSEKGLDVVGIDISENLIAIAKRENPNLEFIVMDMYDTEKLERGFDSIFAQASLLHIPKKDLENILNKFVSRLKNDGLLYIAVKGVRQNYLEEEIREENDYGYPYKRFFSYYSVDELKKHFEDLGLKIVFQDVKKTGKTDWIQIIGRK